jgi:SAM-dependent methyltransferase
MLLKQVLSELSKGLIIDLGCGEGSLDEVKGLNVLGVDIDKSQSFKGDYFVVGDMRKLPVKSRTADLVVMNHSLEHVEEFENCLSEAARTSKKFLYISVPDGSSFDDRLFRTLGRIMKGKSSHVNRFSFEDIVGNAEKSGFRLIESGNVKSGFTYLPKPLDRTIVKMASVTDRIFSSNTKMYGWEFLFEKIGDPN